jgi:hypothetical protein
MTGGRRRLAAVAGVVALLVLATGCGGGDPKGRYAGVSSTAATRAPDRPAKGAEAAGGFRSVRGYRATPAPVRIEIPSIGVASSLDRLGRARDRTVEVPSRWEVAGWYAPGTRPGDPGSAVILGHVDSKGGPAVFFRLRELRRGDEITMLPLLVRVTRGARTNHPAPLPSFVRRQPPPRLTSQASLVTSTRQWWCG